MYISAMNMDSTKLTMDDIAPFIFAIRTLYVWVGQPSRDLDQKEKVCAAASKFTRFSSFPRGTLYRGLYFEDISYVEKLYSMGGLIPITGCESWTTNLSLATEFADLDYRASVSLLVSKKFRKEDFLAKMEGIYQFLELLHMELKQAIKLKEVKARVKREFSWFEEETMKFVKEMSKYKENEILMRTSPLLSGDVITLKFRKKMDERAQSKLPALMELIDSQHKYTMDDLLGWWLHVKNGKITGVTR